MPSQEEIRICEPVDNLNHIFSYENDLKSQLHRPLCHQNGLTKQPSSQLNKGSTRTDNSSGHKNTHQLNSEAANGKIIANGTTDNDNPNSVRTAKNNGTQKESFEPIPMLVACLTYMGFYFLMLLGFLNQLLFAPKVATERNREGYAPLYDSFEQFYLRYVYRRIRDCFNRPICSVPGDEVTLKDRITKDRCWTFEFTGTETKCLNLGSYNYLGFASNSGPCAENSIQSIREYGLASCSSRSEFGSIPLHTELEELTARYLGVDDAITFGMGFGTNSLNIPALLSPGCLVVSDVKNHASIILGLRLSGATVKVFQHNDMHDLERVLKNAIVNGQPKSGLPWKKILIVVEGVFSMEGSIVKLPEVIALKKKYKAYIYLDEAHSIGAMGENGGGIVDFYKVDPHDVDILMGTFTKSFGSAGGYIAGSKKLINYLRVHSHAHCYASSMSPPVAQQIISSMRIIMGLDGTGEGKRRTEQLARNSLYFRRRLAQMGVITIGHDNSPVVPMMVYLFSKIAAVVRELLDHKIAAVGVGFPATPIMAGRIRFCLSAAHTKEQLDHALDIIDEVADKLGLKYSRKPRAKGQIEY